VDIDNKEQVRTRWCNRGTPERAEVLIPGHGSWDSLVFVQVKGGNNEIIPPTLETGTGGHNLLKVMLWPGHRSICGEASTGKLRTTDSPDFA